MMDRDAKVLDQEARAREKQLSREADEQALASGEKTREQLRRENHLFAGQKFELLIDPSRLA